MASAMKSQCKSLGHLAAGSAVWALSEALGGLRLGWFPKGTDLEGVNEVAREFVGEVADESGEGCVTGNWRSRGLTAYLCH